MNLNDNQDLYIGISEKKDGSMKNSKENRFLFFKNKKLDNKNIISTGLVHGSRVAIVDNVNKSKVIKDCDALITNQKNCLLTITVADCLPIYFYDKNKKIIALAHAGWRGVVLNIASELINIFTNYYSSNLNDIEIFIGPHIKDCHFEVKDDVLGKFKISESIIRDKKKYINLSQVVKDQLLQLNISSNNITISDECTYCLNDKYFSYRRDKPEELETMISYIGLR